MIRTLVFLGLVAFAAPFGASESKSWTEDLCYLFDIFNGFHFLPLILEKAKEQKFIQVQGPALPSGYVGLNGMWIKKDQTCNLIGLYYDKDGRIAALQINQPIDKVTSYFDVKKQGFKIWRYNGVEYLYVTLYFVPEDGQTPSKSYDATKVIRNDHLTLSSFDGKLDKVATFSKTLDPIWTKQACIPFMGRHFYYNMTQSLPCGSPFHPFFPLYDEHNDQLIGAGFMYLGTSQCGLEKPSLSAVKMIVETGPQCLYDLVEEYTASTLHVYFVNRPRFITC